MIKPFNTTFYILNYKFNSQIYICFFIFKFYILQITLFLLRKLFLGPFYCFNYLYISSKNNFINYFSFFFKLFFILFFFIGKEYKLVISNRSTITFNFGFSHRYYIYNLNTVAVQLAKTKFMIYGLNFFNVLLKAKDFYYIKPLNIFTLRGIRFSKQIVFKKVGKVSLYM